jgi:hypothetical protein
MSDGKTVRSLVVLLSGLLAIEGQASKKKNASFASIP